MISVFWLKPNTCIDHGIKFCWALYIRSEQKLFIGPHISKLMLICSFFHKLVSSMCSHNSKWKFSQKNFHMLTSLLQHIHYMYGLLFHYLVFFSCPSSSFLFVCLFVYFFWPFLSTWVAIISFLRSFFAFVINTLLVPWHFH